MNEVDENAAGAPDDKAGMADTAASVLRGSCLCGEVRLTIAALNRHVVYCHCTQCRKQSGHFFAALNVRASHLDISGEDNLTWYAASADAQRGFCRHCGSALLWKPNTGEHVSVLAGCLDDAGELSAEAHIYTADKGSYYTIADGLPQYPGSDRATG